jgi:hypothetical protein
MCTLPLPTALMAEPTLSGKVWLPASVQDLRPNIIGTQNTRSGRCWKGPADGVHSLRRSSLWVRHSNRPLLPRTFVPVGGRGPASQVGVG